MMVAPLAERDMLMCGMNMVAYPGGIGAWIDAGNGTEYWESVDPFWFRVGFNLECLESSLDTMLKMGVRYVRSCALIFQFMDWDATDGYTGLNASAIANFNIFLGELGRRGMRLTPSFMGPRWPSWSHPSLRQFYQVLNTSSGMSHAALQSVGQAIVDFVEHYQTNSVIFSWDLVSGFSGFIAHLEDPIDGFGLDVDASEIYDLMETVAEGIRVVDNRHLVTMTDDWPWSFGEESWLSGQVPPFYNESLVELVDYISVETFTDNATLPVVRYLQKPLVLSAVSSAHPTNRSANCRLLLDTFSEAFNKSYSGFVPWELSETFVIAKPADGDPVGQVLHWTWEALLLFTLYRDDSINFLNTTDYRLLASEPVFGTDGHVTMDLFMPEEIDGSGIKTNLVSRFLVMGPPVQSNSGLNVTSLLFPMGALHSLDNAGTLVRLSGMGSIIETGVRIENSSSWTALIEDYQPRRIRLLVNSTDSADIAIDTGSFRLVAGRKYRVVETDLTSGLSTQLTVEATQFLNLSFGVQAGSMRIEIIPLVDILNLFSLGASAGAVVMSLVLYYFFGRRGPRPNGES